MKIVLDILLALIGAMLFPRLVSMESPSVFGGMLTVVVFGVLLFLFRVTHWKGGSWRKWVFSHLAGGCFSLLTAFGFALEVHGTVDYAAWQLWTAVGFYTHGIGQLFMLSWSCLDRLQPALSAEAKGKPQRALEWALGRPYILLPFMLLCWLPCYLGIYPGNFVYDATKEFGQLASGWLGDLPMLHSVLITGLLRWSMEQTGSANTGIAVFTVGQMLLLAGFFTHILWDVRRAKVNRWICLAMTVYYGAFPAVHVLVTSTVRDVLFSGLLTYTVFWIWKLCREPKKYLASWWRPMFPALTAVLTVFARNNNTGFVMPILLAVLAGALLLAGGKKGWKGALVFGLASLILYGGVGYGLNGICSPATEPSTNASMTVFSQSLVRAYVQEGENWSEGDKLEFQQYVNTKNLSYVAENGDSTKGRLKVTEENTDEFLKFWWRIGAQYPNHYADAVMTNTRSAWFPGVIMDGYQKRNISVYKDYEKCWFYYADSIEEPGVLNSKLPAVHDWYRDLSLNISFEKVPVLGLLFSVGTHFWLLLACLFTAMYRKNRHAYLPLLVLLGYTLISMCVPLMILRYFAALIFAFPLVLMLLVQESTGKRSLEN